MEPSILPKWQEAVPNFVEYRMRKAKDRPFTERRLGYCLCSNCTELGLKEPVELRTYVDHDRKERKRQANAFSFQPIDKQDRNVLKIIDSAISSTAMDPAAVSFSDGSSPATDDAIVEDTTDSVEDYLADAPNLGVVSCATFAVEEVESTQGSIPGPQSAAETGYPVTASLSRTRNWKGKTSVDRRFLQIKHAEKDYIRYYDALIANSLVPADIQLKIRTGDPGMSLLERCIYTQVVAMVGQYNLPQDAASCILSDMWSAVGCGYLVGAGKGNAPETETSSAQINRFSQSPSTKLISSLFSDLTLQPLRSFSGAQRRLGIAQPADTIIHPNCSNHECQHVYYETIKTQQFETGSICEKCEVPADGMNNIGLVPYPRMRLVEALEKFFLVSQTETLCEGAEGRRAKDAEKDDALDFKVYREAHSGSAWAARGANGELLDEQDQLILRLNIGIDWYNPNSSNHARSRSIGPVMAQVLNLPQELRGKLGLVLLFGITPGPKEPRGSNLWKYLLPLAVELRKALVDGINVRTPKHPQGRKVFVVVTSLSADAPARIGVTGGPHYNVAQGFCIRCTANFASLYNPETEWQDRDVKSHNSLVYDQRELADMFEKDARAKHNEQQG